MSKPKTMPYGALERDLCGLAGHRVSVLQLADTKETQFLITLHAMTAAVGMCSGAYSAVYRKKLEDPFEIAKVIMDLASEIKAEAQP